MTTAATSLLGLALPVTGELAGTWGDTVNDSITSLLDSAVAGTTTLSTDGDVTLTTTTLAANQARQAILLCSGARTALRTITAPAQSKIYTIINATTGGYSVKLVGAGPTTGVTVVAGESALVAWNGSDFIKISNTGGSASFTNVTVSGTTTLSGLTASTALALNASKEVVSVTNTGTGNNVLAGSPTLTGTVNAAAVTMSSDLTLSGGTANGVLYLNGSKVATSGSALTFDGTNLNLGASAASSVAGSVGTLTLGGTNANVSGGVAYQVNGTAKFYQYVDTGGVFKHQAQTGIVQAFFADGSEQMRLTSTGLGIGTSSPSTKLSLYGSGVPASMTFENSSGARNYEIGTGYAGAGSTSNFYIWDNTANVGRVILNSSGNLGIGTSSPTALAANYTTVDVRGSSGGAFRFGNATNSAYIYSDSNETNFATATAKPLLFGTDATERMRLDTSGNLGLGVTPSAWASTYKAFQIGSVGRSLAQTGAGVGDLTLAFNAIYSSANSRWDYAYTGDAAVRYSQTGSGIHAWYTSGSGTAGNAISFSQVMTLDASGNLGVGATSPSGRLHIATGGETTSRFDGSRGSADNLPVVTIPFWNVSNGVGDKQIATIGVLTGTSSNQTQKGQIYFSTSDGTLTERARIDSSGNLLVGTTSAVSASGRVVILGAGSSSNALVVRNNSDTIVYETTQSSGTSYYGYFLYNGTTVGSITSTGSSTLYNTSSDYRLKDNQQPLTGSGAFIDALQPKTWNWKADGSRGVGFIAHEVQEVSPGSVVGEKDGERMQAMEYGSAEFIANIIAEIQSLRKRLADAGIA